jgi:hypothetical protein
VTNSFPPIPPEPSRESSTPCKAKQGVPRTDSFSPDKPLDPLVKIALSLSVGLILITIIGMILTAPDRSIPPYSVTAQVEESVTVNVPPNTTDPQIEALLLRFRAAGGDDQDGFRRLKIKPTTPKDPDGLYQRVTIYILGNPGLAEETVLRDYLAGDPAAKGAFERSVRGLYRLTPSREIGIVGYSEQDAKRIFQIERPQ